MGVIPINFSVEAEVFLRKKDNMSRYVNKLVVQSMQKVPNEQMMQYNCSECGYKLPRHASRCKHYTSEWLSGDK